MLEFDWNPDKAASNLTKHGVDFREAASVFFDTLSISFADGKHSDGEARFLTFGTSDRNRVLVVSHTESEYGIRIISARRVTNAERKIYEEGN